MNRFYTNKDYSEVYELAPETGEWLSKEDVLENDAIHVIEHYADGQSIEDMFIAECYKNSLIPCPAIEDAIKRYLASYGDDAEYTINPDTYYPEIKISKGKKCFEHYMPLDAELTGDLKKDMPSIIDSLMADLDEHDLKWLVDDKWLNVDDYVPNTMRASYTDRDFSFCVYIEPADIDGSVQQATKELEAYADDLLAYYDSDMTEVRTYYDLEDISDTETEVLYKDAYDAEKEMESRGAIDLGEYDSVEDCIEKNAELLGLKKNVERVAYVGIEKEYYVNESPDFMKKNFPPVKEMPGYISDGDCFGTTDGNVLRVGIDDCSESPREWSNVGTFLTFERRYNSPDNNPYDSFVDFLEEYGIKTNGRVGEDIQKLADKFDKEGGILLPVSVYEHGGREYYVGNPADHVDGRWDAGYAGVIFATKETLEKEGITKEMASESLEGEVEVYNRWANGEVYEARLCDRTGEEIDSLGGLYGPDDLAGNFSISKPLGNYDSIESCIKDNMDELGISVQEKEVKRTREETSYSKKSKSRGR